VFHVRPTLCVLSLAVVALTDRLAGAQQPARTLSRAAAPSTSDSSAKSPFGSEAFAGLRARSIGPAMTSGRVMSVAVHPADPGIIYVGTASGGLWKTVSGGARGHGSSCGRSRRRRG